MNNIFKYIREYGEFTFDEKKVTEVDILIFVPTMLMVMDGGVRRDAIAAAIDRLVNNNLSLGIGEVRRIPGACKEPMDGYRLRILRYRVGNYNNLGETLNAFRYD